jgi:two-component system, OmpR family, KDP operon response regulator KdpE
MHEKEIILVIDDELQIRRLLEITLSANGYGVCEASNGKEGLIIAATRHPSLVMLDLGLPDADGQQILVKLREWYSKPVIVLSVRNSEEDIITALDNGANDYITKPFKSGELLARIRAALRYNEGKVDDAVIEIGPIQIDFVNHIAKRRGEILKLTSTEFALLSLLVKNQGRVLTHQYILKEVWGFGYISQTQYLRVFIAQIRKKIEDDPSNPKLLITESGIGYRLTPPPHISPAG